MIPNRPQEVACAVVFVMLATLSTGLGAGSFQVNPVRIEMRDGATNSALIVRNDGTEPVVVQTSVLAWAQAEGKDVYVPTTEALATPPIATIAPGGEQVLRVGLRRRPDPQRELAYRLYVQEIPGAPQADFQGLQVALRVGIPVFVAPVASISRELDWVATRSPDGDVRLSVRNRGNVHLQVYDFVLRAATDGESEARETQIAYVLAGESHEWILRPAKPLPAAASMLRLTAYTDAGEINASVRLDP
jgi:fimbrial chaperone protein